MSYHGYDVDWNPGIREMLLQRGARPDVIDLIESIPDPQIRGKVVNFVRSHTEATTDDIDNMLREMPKQRTLTEGELSILKSAGTGDFDTPLGRWAAIQIVKHGVLGFGGAAKGEWSPATWITKLQEIRDWSESEDLEIASYNLERAIRASDEWHAAMAGKGSGHYYDNSGQIVHQWEDGWTIRTMVSFNDIKAEGEKMANCLRSSDQYFNDVQSGKAALFSLRDPDNKPHISIHFSKGALAQAKAFQNARMPAHLASYVIDWLRATGYPIKNVSEITGFMDTLPEWMQPIDLPPDLVEGVRNRITKWMDYETLEREKQRLTEAAMDRYEAAMRKVVGKSAPRTPRALPQLTPVEVRQAEQEAWAEYAQAMAEIQALEREHSEEGKKQKSQAFLEKKQFGRVLTDEDREKIENLLWRIV